MKLDPLPLWPGNRPCLRRSSSGSRKDAMCSIQKYSHRTGQKGRQNGKHVTNSRTRNSARTRGTKRKQSRQVPFRVTGVL